eukprot:CAMPEP_0119047354 /NCGR_PEP_ID=MMETSP1177-20130426/52735_1 /TAXON_ID=2985 /ORGANISM="Ochromonas sp, Strain CCMP1899" /LENGTH=387 /DNA_ID=CAMNT_0007021867 /DNA_START=73 /DNA_END=1233 /DNA_ORIENTATION=-
MKVQSQIRQNAEEVSSYLTEMNKWENKINKKVTKRSTTTSKALPVRLGSGTVKVIEKPVTENDTAAGHTYDVGYQKWDKFNVDAALEADNDETANQSDENDRGVSEVSSLEDGEIVNLTPASLVKRYSSSSSARAVPVARGIASTKDAETAERERGNEEFSTGNFSAAVKSYTKCLGLKGKNYVAFSNRAMAYIKLKEFIRAETDCSSALSIDPSHIKSLIRRATAKNALGKHRSALADLNTAAIIEPFNKQIRAELQRTREILKSTVNRAPLVSITTAWEDESSSGRMQGPDRGPVHGSDGGPDQGLVHGSDGPKEGPDFETEPDHGSNNGADERANRSQINHNESIIPVIEKTVDAKAELNDNHSKENDTSTRLTIEESDPVQPW